MQAGCLHFVGDLSIELQCLEANFHRVVEFNAPVTMSVTSDAAGLEFVVAQNGTAAMAASARISVSGDVAVSL
ncbi:hypothetical protein GCM10025870_17820 [Agromyces marinus]|uniref:Uncharacterized protein n=1 Tax=Agromyces marinus TaxID=1389020 RepID=A0ABN6YBI4_9MICO|nr:hypothetical protein GCM10025870_17820 [Agromyces marinus]